MRTSKNHLWACVSLCCILSFYWLLCIFWLNFTHISDLFKIPMSPCIIALHVKNSPSDLWELSKNVKLLQDWTKFVGLKGFEADLICSRLKLSKCAIAIPGPKPHIYYSIFCILSTCSTCSLHNKLSLPEIFGTFINAGVRKPKDKSKVRKNIFRSGYRDKNILGYQKYFFLDIRTKIFSGYQNYFSLRI